MMKMILIECTQEEKAQSRCVLAKQMSHLQSYFFWSASPA